LEGGFFKLTGHGCCSFGDGFQMIKLTCQFSFYAKKITIP
jgi:hypothetical protein